MKKATAIVLAFLMAVTLFACNSSPSTSSPSESAATSENTPSASAAESTPAATPETTALTIPKVDFAVEKDPFSREKYKICDITVFLTPFGAMMNDAYAQLGEKLNYEFSHFDAAADVDQFINLIETCAGQDYDGMIIEGDFTTEGRILDLVKEYDIKYVPGLSPFVDAEGKYIASSAVMDSFDLGGDALAFMVDNYEKYTGIPFAAEDIGFIAITWSVITDLQTRVDGAYAKYNELFPDLVDTNYYYTDTSAGSTTNPVTAEAAYNLVSATVAAHPEVKGWIVFGSIEDYADGAARALEAAGKKGNSIVTSDASTTLMSQWDNGYEGVWVAGIDTPTIQWADATVSGLIQMIDGTATHDTLWTNMREQGQNFTVLKLPYTIVEKANYKEYQKAMDSYINEMYPAA